MNTFRISWGIFFMAVLIVGPVLAQEAVKPVAPASSGKATLPVKDDFKNDWASVSADTKEMQEKLKVAKAQEQDLRDQMEKASKAGDAKKVDQLREQLKALHQKNMKSFREGKKEVKDNQELKNKKNVKKQKEYSLESEKKSIKPPRGGKYLESRINPGTDSRNRHLDRRERSRSSDDLKTKNELKADKDQK